MTTIQYTIIAIAVIGLLATSTWEIYAMEQQSSDVDKAMAEKKAMEDKAMAEKKAMEDKAMAEKKAMEDKAMAEKKAMEDKAMAEKKAMANKADISELKKLVSNIEKSLTVDDKAKPEIKAAMAKLKAAVSSMEKAMSSKSMSEKKAMAEKKAMEDKAMAEKKAMEDKAMAEKKAMEGKAMEHKGLTIGGIDLSNASPVLGSKNAKITIIEFGDFQCPKCNQWYKSEEPKIKSQYISTNKANLYFVDFAWLGSDSEKAAQAAHCADEQGKFWEYHDVLYKNQGGIQDGWANQNELKKFAKNIGLDTTKFSQCLESGKHKPHVEFNTKLGEDNGVTATPVFFIVANDKVEKIVGPQPISAFSSVIEKLLK